MSDQTISYDLETDVPQTYFGKLIEFMYKRYLVPKAENVKDIKKDSSDKNPSLSFTITDPTNHTTVRAHVTTDGKVHLKLVPLEEAWSEGVIARLKEDIEIVIDYFEESVQAHTLFFAWREGETVVPEKVSEKGKGSINRLFLETQVLLFVLFIVIGAVLFLTIGATLFFIVPIVLLAMQFMFVFFSKKIIAKIADWQITEKESHNTYS
jgi:ABC-type multidrug transport system fused ATPase/permease subunit